MAHHPTPSAPGAPAAGRLDPGSLLDAVESQLREGAVRIPNLADDLQIPFYDLILAMNDLRQRGFLRLLPDPPFFEITDSGHALRARSG